MKIYFIIGGMPAAVKTWIEKRDFVQVEEIQRGIINTYIRDFSKHAPGNIVPRINHIWESLPSQLSKENKKFVYGHVREGARAREYEEALLWLSDAGLIRKVSRVSKGVLPLPVYSDLKAFKLFHLDVGLLRLLCGAAPAAIMEGGRVFEEFKGALAEQYILQELCATHFAGGIYYWSSGVEAEVDFVVSDGNLLFPVEVKSGHNVHAKSMKEFIKKYGVKNAVRFSLEGLKQDGRILNVPLYLAFNIENYLEALVR